MSCAVCGAEMRPIFEMVPETDLGKQYLPQELLLTPRVIVECRDCGLGTYRPQLDERQTAALYGANYHAFLKTPAEAAARNDRDGEHAARLLRWELGRIGITVAGSHLDVGCAFGGLLAHSWLEPKYGIEIGEAPLRWLRGRDEMVVSDRPIDARPFPGVRFGLVTMFDVIEHLHHPQAAVRAAFETLAPGGALVVTTPDFHGVRRRLRGPRWRMFQLEHLWYFTADSLRRIVVDAGFAHVHVLHSNRLTAGLIDPGELFTDLPPWLRWLDVRGVRRATLAALRLAGWTDDLKVVAVKR